MQDLVDRLVFDYDSVKIGESAIVHADCLEWLQRVPENTIHAVVTDPPYGVKEYDIDQLAKRANRSGGVWRLPPSFDGCQRSPLPRFTALNSNDRSRLSEFFIDFGKLLLPALRPGSHVLIATNSFVSQLVYASLVNAGLEFRGEIIRLVRTLRGGDRPKNAEKEFPDVCSMPRGCYEPWGIFRKAIPSKMTIAECLREFQTGGLRCQKDGKPFEDIIDSERTPKRERGMAKHPSLKPQSLLRRLAYASLPLGKGIIVDPFMGSGSTIAAAAAVGLTGIGIERLRDYYDLAKLAIPRLSDLI